MNGNRSFHSKPLLLLLLAASSCRATDYTYNTTFAFGLWGTPTNWTPNGVPGNNCGDTVSIPDGMTVTLNQNICIGTSGPNGTIAINLNNTGQLIVDGGHLEVRGDVVTSGSPDGNFAVKLQNGSSWTWNSSAASSPGATHYQFRHGGANGYRAFIANGTSGSHISISSNPGGGAGQFAGGNSHGGNFQSVYTDFSNIGDASHFGWQVSYNADPTHGVRWDATHSTFTNCGVIVGDNSLGPETGGFFRHSYNVHSQSAGGEILSNWINIADPTGSTLEIRNNVFDTSMSRTSFYLGGFTVWSNYFGDATLTGPGGWSLFQGNFLRFSDYWPNNSTSMRVGGDMLDSYIFVDSDWGNNKPLGQNSNVAANLRGIVYGQGGTGHGPPQSNDSGELWFNYSAANPTQYGIYNSILLPNMSGFGSLEIGALTPAFTNMLAIAEHVTYFGGFSPGGPGGTDQFAAIDTEEGAPCCSGQLLSFRSNILWNPELQSDSQGNAFDYRSSFFKLKDLTPSAPQLDVCAPGNCDFNTGWNHTLVFPSGSFTNQGKGYAGRFSAPPGAHDVDANPMFVDFQRSLELFDSKYLGHSYAAWTPGASYSVGSQVTWRRQDTYWALPVNFRYINSTGCNGANPEPAHGAGWRNCWEWSSLYSLRQAVAAGTTYDDQNIGASRDDVIITLLKWIRAGYSPTNSQLAGAAHDGTDIGAVPVSFSPQTPNTGASIHGGVVK